MGGGARPSIERVYMIGYQSNSIVIHDEGICNVEIVSSLFYDGWNVKTLKCHRWKAEGDKPQTFGHHERLWTPKLQSLMLFCAFGCFVGLQVMCFWCFILHRSGATNLNWAMEQVPCCWCNGSLMEMHITLCEGGWLRVWTPLMKGGLRTWISKSFHGRKRTHFWSQVFLLLCLCVFCKVYWV
jgi:hypothetical protein